MNPELTIKRLNKLQSSDYPIARAAWATRRVQRKINWVSKMLERLRIPPVDPDLIRRTFGRADFTISRQVRGYENVRFRLALLDGLQQERMEYQGGTTSSTYTSTVYLAG